MQNSDNKNGIGIINNYIGINKTGWQLGLLSACFFLLFLVGWPVAAEVVELIVLKALFTGAIAHKGL